MTKLYKSKIGTTYNKRAHHKQLKPGESVLIIMEATGKHLGKMEPNY